MNGGIRMPKYELSITKNYAPDWTLSNAIRELFQNALDQETVCPDNPMSWNYDKETQIMTISNAKSKLETKSLLLGSTTKVDNDDTIGQFGEGYKIATLVLTRLGKRVTIFNYGAKEVWHSYFKYSKKYDAEILMFDVDKKFPWTKVPDNDLTIKISGITEEEFNIVVDSNLHMQENYTHIESEQGQILLDDHMKGRMFVNGLYIITDSSFEYGYNFKPFYIELDRDRRLIPYFELKWVTSKMWTSNQSSEATEIATKLLEKGAVDVAFIRESSHGKAQLDAISNNVMNNFISNYGENAVPVYRQEDAEKVPDTHRPIIVPETVVKAITYNVNYTPVEQVKEPTFIEKLEEWLDKYGGNIKRDARRDLIGIIKEEKEKQDD